MTPNELLSALLHAAVRAADVVVVAMGNDGALASVVAGLVEAPVIAVPTSVGYGAALQVGALLELCCPGHTLQASCLHAAKPVGCWIMVNSCHVPL